MGRPAKFDRDEALETATHAIWKHGYDRASAKALSELLGITRSSFYNSFTSREALFAEAVSVYAGLSPDAPLRQEFDGPVLPLLNAVFREIVRVRAADPEARGCMIVNTVADCAPAEDGPGKLAAELVLRSARRFEELLQLARDNGEIPAGTDIHAIALALQNLVVGLNVMCKAVRDEHELWLAVHATLQGLGLAFATAADG